MKKLSLRTPFALSLSLIHLPAPPPAHPLVTPATWSCNRGWCSSAPGVHLQLNASPLAHWMCQGFGSFPSGWSVGTPAERPHRATSLGRYGPKGQITQKNANFADGNLCPMSSVGAVYVAVCRGRAYQSQIIQGAPNFLEVCRRGKAHLAPNRLPDPF